MERYSIKKLSGLAGVSVRTLHLYDEIGLLKPAVRTEAGYRQYGEKELLRLQQILFYKELDFTLQDIAAILDNADFNLVQALERHKAMLRQRQQRLETLVHTLDKTIYKLKNGMQLKHEELYDGLPKETAEAWKREAIEKYGAEIVERSERSLTHMTKEAIAQLKEESRRITEGLLTLVHEDPESEKVQTEIGKHYIIIRQFWGTHGDADKQAEAYAGLGRLYVEDERFTMTDGKPNAAFAGFMCKAMAYFAKTKLG